MFFHPDYERLADDSEFNGNMAILLMRDSIRDPTSSWALVDRYSVFRNFHIQPLAVTNFIPEISDHCEIFGWMEENHLRKFDLQISSRSCSNSSSVFCARINENSFCGQLGATLVCGNKFAGFAITNSCHAAEVPFISIGFYEKWIKEASSGNSIFKNYFLKIFIALLFITLN
jgi:hypothetical protein